MELEIKFVFENFLFDAKTQQNTKIEKAHVILFEDFQF